MKKELRCSLLMLLIITSISAFCQTNNFPTTSNATIGGSNQVEFGAGLTKQSDAGKIGYQTFSGNALDIVGAGTTTANRKIKLFAEGGTIFTGNIGIGNSNTASYSLDISTTGDYQGIQLYNSSGRWLRFFSSIASGGYNGIVAQNDAGIIFGDDGGTLNNGFVIAPHYGDNGLRINNDGTLHGFQVFGNNQTNGSIRFGFSTTNDGLLSLGFNPSMGRDALKFSYFPHGSASGQVDLMTLDVNGNVGIGTTSPDAKLTVSGQVHAQEVKVTVAAPGPDYVFEKDYALPTLEQIKTYIDANKHLPEVPSAKDMEKDGVKLGEMNMVLLKKVEELTLYVIEQDRKFKIQEEKIAKQQRLNEAMQKQMEELAMIISKK